MLLCGHTVEISVTSDILLYFTIEAYVTHQKQEATVSKRPNLWQTRIATPGESQFPHTASERKRPVGGSGERRPLQYTQPGCGNIRRSQKGKRKKKDCMFPFPKCK